MAHETTDTPQSVADGGTLRRSRRKSAYLLTETDEPLLLQLNPKHAELPRQQGSMADIAERLGIATGTGKSRTNQARAALDQLRQQSQTATQH
jgi:hypothetical protein